MTLFPEAYPLSILASQSVPLPTVVVHLLKHLPSKPLLPMPSPSLPMLIPPLAQVLITSPLGSSPLQRNLPFAQSTMMSRMSKQKVLKFPVQIPTAIAPVEVHYFTQSQVTMSLSLAQIMDTGVSMSMQLLAPISIMTVREVCCMR